MPDTERTESPSRQEALLLWNDTRRILAQGVGNERLRAMMEACEPTSLDRNLLTVRTRSGFAKHNLDVSKAKILRALSEAAFEPMDLSVEFEEIHWDENPQFPDLILRGFKAEVTPFPGMDSDGESDRDIDPNAGALSISDSEPEPTSGHPTIATDGRLVGPAGSAGSASDIPSNGSGPADVIPFGISQSSLTEDEFRRQFASDLTASTGAGPTIPSRRRNRRQAPPEENIGDIASHFTFDTFVEGEENQFAFVAAKEVANGNTNQFNPLFIHGDSGLGKTHLLLSIKNYIAANDPSRICTYKTAREFTSDYTAAMSSADKDIKDALVESYRGVDVLILDDIQHLSPRAVNTIEFFFDTFNYLISYGKQIVLAADVPPSELGGMDPRITSRMAQGFQVSIQHPSLELKRNLIHTFYDRNKADNLPGYEGEITPEVLDTMAEYCGNNIRLIKAYVQQALFLASQIQRTDPGSEFTVDDAESLAKERGLVGHHNVTIDEIQSIVEHEMGVSHSEIVSNKRNKEIAQARHVAIWLCRQLTDNTYKDIGLRFGGRSHTTCLHSCEWVDGKLRQRTDRYLIDTISKLRRRLEAL